MRNSTSQLLEESKCMISIVIGSIIGCSEMFIEMNTLIFDFALAEEPGRLNLECFQKYSPYMHVLTSVPEDFFSLCPLHQLDLAQFIISLVINSTCFCCDSCSVNIAFCFSY